MTLLEQRAVCRPGPCKTCKGRKQCRTRTAMICPAFTAWTTISWEQRAREEYRAHLRWMMRCMTWKEK